MATTPAKRRTHSPLFWVTEASTGTNHLVTEAAFTTGVQSFGWYRAICGTHFPAAPMIEAPRRTCANCRAVRAAERTGRHQEPRDISWWRRLRRRNARLPLAHPDEVPR